MKQLVDINKKTPEYFRAKAFSIEDRNNLPVDCNCMYLNHCIKHPVDVMYELMEKAAEQHQKQCIITAEDIMRNTDIYNNPTIEEHHVALIKGFLWWKKTTPQTIKRQNENEQKLLGVIARNTLDELDRVLHNKGFVSYRLKLKERFTEADRLQEAQNTLKMYPDDTASLIVIF